MRKMRPEEYFLATKVEEGEKTKFISFYSISFIRKNIVNYSVDMVMDRFKLLIHLESQTLDFHSFWWEKMRNWSGYFP